MYKRVRPISQLQQNPDDNHIPPLLILTSATLLVGRIINSPGRLLVKHIILRLLLALLTFSAGVGLHRLTSKRKPVEKSAISELYRSSRASVAPTSHFLFRGESVLPSSRVICDYNPAKFDPVAELHAVGKKKKCLAAVSFLLLSTGTDGQVTVSISDLGGQETPETKLALVTDRRLFFVTDQTSDGFEYRFDGEFLLSGTLYEAPEGKVVLKGTLTKSKNGRAVVEWPLKFEVVQDRC